MFNIFNFYELSQSIGNIQDMIVDLYKVVWRDNTPKFIKRLKQGIVYYTKPINDFLIDYKKPSYNRRITSKRVFTHTKK